MKNFLSEQERVLLKIRHKKERDKRVCDRIKAILLYDTGWTIPQIAEVLLLTDNAVRHHISEFQTSQKLKPSNGGSSEKLSEEDSKSLERHLNMHTYLHVKDIVSYVFVNHGIRYTIAGMTCWLNRHGFSYKKPSLVPGKANQELQKKWIEEYEQLKKELPKDETICFMDGVHPTHNTQLAYGWIKKGLRKELKSNTGRSRLNISGALDILSKRFLAQENETLNAESTIAFLQKIEEAYPEKTKVHLFSDNAKYYKNKTVQSFLTTSKVKLHFLPPYSPNLNPIERLWKLMKETILYNVYYENFKDFKHAVLGFLEKVSYHDPTSSFGKILESRVRDRFRATDVPLFDNERFTLRGNLCSLITKN